MIIYANNSYKPRKKRKVKGEVYAKYKGPSFQPLDQSSGTKSYNMVRLEESKAIPSNLEFRGSGSQSTAKQESQRYTGDYIIGIATMHKSNAVPVTNPETAKDIAKMRR